MEQHELKQKITEFLEAGEGYKNESVENLNLSVKTYNCLRRYCIRCLEDANGRDIKNLIKIRNLGKKGLQEFLEAAEKFGYIVKHGTLVRIFELKENQTTNNEENILIVNTDMSENLQKRLKFLGCRYISDIADNLQFKGNRVKVNKLFIEELEKEMIKYGYTLNKTGFFVKTMQENEQSNILLEQFKKEGLKALNLIDLVYFKKDSYSMNKINKAFEAYLNFLVEEKIKKNNDFGQIEKEIDQIKENYKVYVDEQRQKLERGTNSSDFIKKMAIKNSEIKRYHHNTNINFEKIHSYNPFFDDEKEV